MRIILADGPQLWRQIAADHSAAAATSLRYAGTPAQLTVAAVSGATWLYYSADGGVRWSVAYRAPVDGGVEFNDLGFTTTADGVAVLGPVYGDGNPYGMPGQLLLTSDGGASWTAVRF